MLSADTEFLTKSGWQSNPKSHQVLCWNPTGATYWEHCRKVKFHDGQDLVSIGATGALQYRASAETRVPLYAPIAGSRTLRLSEETVGSVVERYQKNKAGNFRKHICTVIPPRNLTHRRKPHHYFPLVLALVHGGFDKGWFYIPYRLRKLVRGTTANEMVEDERSGIVRYKIPGCPNPYSLFDMQQAHCLHSLRQFIPFDRRLQSSRYHEFEGNHLNELQVILMGSGRACTIEEGSLRLYKKMGLMPVRYGVTIAHQKGASITTDLKYAVTRYQGRVCVLDAS